MGCDEFWWGSLIFFLLEGYRTWEGNGEIRTLEEKNGASLCTGFVGHCRNEVFVTNIAKRNRLFTAVAREVLNFDHNR